MLMRMWGGKGLSLAKVMEIRSVIMKSIVENLQKLKTVLPFDPTVLFLAIHPKEMKPTYKETPPCCSWYYSL